MSKYVKLSEKDELIKKLRNLDSKTKGDIPSIKNKIEIVSLDKTVTK